MDDDLRDRFPACASAGADERWWSMGTVVRWTRGALVALFVCASASCVSVSRRAAPPVEDAADVSTTPDVPVDAEADVDSGPVDADADTGADVSAPAQPAPSVTPAWLVGTSEGDGWRLQSVGTGTALRGTSSSVEGWTLRARE